MMRTRSQIEDRVFRAHRSRLHAKPSTLIPDRNVTADETAPAGPNDIRNCCCRIFHRARWLSGMRIVVDCANGAMSQVAPELLSGLGAECRSHECFAERHEHQCWLRRRASGFAHDIDEEQQRPILELHSMATGIGRCSCPAAAGCSMAMQFF